MIGRMRRYFQDLEDRQRIAIALARGARMAARRVDLRDPASWEHSAFSQNGEDGVLDVLRSQSTHCNRSFIEIGAADGIDNNSAWLAIAEKYCGLMVEGDAHKSARARRLLPLAGVGTECLAQFVTRASVPALVQRVLFRDPDVCSLDIDGNDYHIADALLQAGLRPKIWVVEYNAAFGPERRVSIEYSDAFDFTAAHPSQLYYGVSIAGWRAFFARHDYRFVTVERNGVNAFFADPTCFVAGFLDGVRGLDFAENRFQLHKFRQPWPQQFERIAGMPLVEI
ncbi:MULTISPECIES: hypothetical protein [Metallibacterium]|uniref:hypothetical protein n=1 Tax=Metallibacterium TaxID=1218803 RepID=UPI00260EA80E|nr:MULTISPECIES: hypothetical protein [Metallibacterium]MBW8073877.1 hypothetical protein [Metallibacterium scheffleri]